MQDRISAGLVDDRWTGAVALATGDLVTDRGGVVDALFAVPPKKTYHQLPLLLTASSRAVQLSCRCAPGQSLSAGMTASCAGV